MSRNDNKMSKHQSAVSMARTERRWTNHSTAAARRAYSKASRQSARFIIDAELDMDASDVETIN